MRRYKGATVLGIAIASAGCVLTLNDVSHSTRGPRYPGYAVEYVSATPSPGSPVVEGSWVEFKVDVRYVLQSRETGILELLYRDARDVDVLPPGAAIPIKRCRWETATLSQRVQIPSGVSELYVTVPVLPDGENTSYGMLQLRYPVLAD